MADDHVALSDSFESATSVAAELAPLLSGRHTVRLRVFDFAGNTKEESKDISVEGVVTPKVIAVPAEVEAGAPFIAEGVADAHATVLVVVEKDGKEFARGETRATGEGRWSYARREGLPRGEYDVRAKMIGPYGTESALSEPMHTRAIPRPLIERFGWIAVAVLAAALLALGAFLWHERRERIKARNIARREAGEVKAKTQAVFEALREEVEEKVQLLDRKPAPPGAPPIEDEFGVPEALDTLKTALDISEETISKEIEDVEKALG